MESQPVTSCLAKLETMTPTTKWPHSDTYAKVVGHLCVYLREKALVSKFTNNDDNKDFDGACAIRFKIKGLN